jgi:hypothetical protein
MAGCRVHVAAHRHPPRKWDGQQGRMSAGAVLLSVLPPCCCAQPRWEGPLRRGLPSGERGAGSVWRLKCFSRLWRVPSHPGGRAEAPCLLGRPCYVYGIAAAIAGHAILACLAHHHPLTAPVYCKKLCEVLAFQLQQQLLLCCPSSAASRVVSISVSAGAASWRRWLEAAAAAVQHTGE